MLEQTRGTARLWPHLLEGEGHYVAVIKRSDETNLELDQELHEEKRGAGQRVPESGLLHEPSDRSFYDRLRFL